jgi:outer membrane protein TolC
LRDKAAKIKTAQSAYNRTASDVVYEVAVNYVNLMWAYQTTELLEKIKEKRIENKDMVKLKYDSGNADLGSLKRVDADVKTAQYDLEKAQRYIKTASAALLKSLGRSDIEKTILKTDEKITFLESPQDVLEIEKILSDIPEFLSAKYEIESYKAQNEKAKSQLFPSVNIAGGLSRFDGKLFPNKESWDTKLSISYPLFTGGKRYSDIKIARNMLKIANENFREIHNSLKSKAIANYNALQDAYQIVSVRKEYLEALKLQAEILARKYVNGLSTYYDWYSIQNDYITAQKNFLDAQKNAKLEKARWKNFIGEYSINAFLEE